MPKNDQTEPGRAPAPGPVGFDPHAFDAASDDPGRPAEANGAGDAPEPTKTGDPGRDVAAPPAQPYDSNDPAAVDGTVTTTGSTPGQPSGTLGRPGDGSATPAVPLWSDPGPNARDPNASGGAESVIDEVFEPLEIPMEDPAEIKRRQMADTRLAWLY